MMLLSPAARRLLLTFHLVVSVGWMGAVAAYLALDVTVATSEDVTTLHASYVAMELVTRWVVVPLAFASLVSGLVMSFGTKWGLFRHWWVVVSLVLTVLAVAVLMVETRVIYAYAEVAADSTSSDQEIRDLGSTLLHSIGGLMVLLVVLVLNVYKPKGLTRYGWRIQQVRSGR